MEIDKRLTATLGALALSGCSGAIGAEPTLAQCQLDVRGGNGNAFRKDYAEGEFVPSGKDASYREFVLLCMEAKGFKFASPFGDKEECWIEDKIGIIPDAWVDGASCYERNWW
jgi:hypothetical protein